MAVVLAIVLTASVPRFQQTAERLRVEQGAVELLQLLRYAQALAVSEGHEITWVWDAQARQARLENVTVDGEQVLREERLAHSRPLTPAVTVNLMRQDAPVDAVRFFSDGTSEATTLQLSHLRRVYRMTVDAQSGQILFFPPPAPAS